MTNPTTPAHTCVYSDQVQPCVACDLETAGKFLKLANDLHAGCSRRVPTVRLVLNRIAARLVELEADRFDLEACAELIVKLDESGPANGNRERVKLLADWQRARKAER